MAIRTTGLSSGMDTEAIVESLMSAQRLKKTKVENKKTKLEWSQDKWKDLNTKIYSLYTGTISKMRLQGSYNLKKATSSDETIATATASSTSATGSHKLEVTKLASSQYVTGKQISGMTSKTTLISKGYALDDTITFASSGTSSKYTALKVTATTTIADVVANAKSAGLNASYDEVQDRLFISSANSGETNQFSIASSNTTGLNGIGLTNIALGAASGTTDGVTLVKAEDATIKLDGATLTGSTNSFTAAGITFNLLDTTATGESITLGVSDDTDGTYDLVKDFIKGYNELLEEMNDSYYASSAKGYDPLTDDEKEAMTDDEIEKWETKIQDSLLRRDSKLGSLIDGMKSAFNKSVLVDGKKFSLSTYGIMTSTDYTEKGLLHIYGDEDDSTYSDKTDKLKAALTADPDTTAKALSAIVTNLYETMTDRMKTSTLNSALTFYNDKQMAKQVKTYEDELDEWEDRLLTMEDRYYKQFTAMEKALANMNSQSSSLASMLGTSS